LGRGAKGDVLRHMQSQEQQHLSTFDALVAERRVRPTLPPFWHLAGLARGAITAALGEKAATACTVAVEDAIDVHYSAQVDAMDDSESDLRQAVEKFRAEELEHRDWP
jgi:ubiquinone biosynthesis monooxygenase Coq7